MSSHGTPASRSVVVRGGYSALALSFLLAGVLPVARGMRSARADIARLSSDIDSRVSQQRDLEEINKSIVEISMQTRNLDRLLPPSQDLGTFLKELTSQFGEAGLQDISYHNLPPTPLGRSQKLPI